MKVAHRPFLDALPSKVNAEPSRKSAEMCDLTLAKLQRGLPAASVPFGKAASDMISATFAAPSRHQIAMNAARALGGSDDTWTRVIANETGRIDSYLLFACLQAYQIKFGKPFAFGGGLGIAIVEVNE